MARHSATVGFESRLGTIEVEASPEGVTRVRFAPRRRPREVGSGPALEYAREARREICAYLDGALQVFTVPVVVGGTPFQRAAWAAISGIPYGTAVTYGELAARLGRPRAARAVGAACAANPVPVLVPCHRVVGGGGALRGFSGGLDVKHTLLALERDVLLGQGRTDGQDGQQGSGGPSPGSPEGKAWG